MRFITLAEGGYRFMFSCLDLIVFWFVLFVCLLFWGVIIFQPINKSITIDYVDYFGCKRNNTDLTQAFINTPCAFYYNHTTAHALLQYRSATYTTFLPSLKYTLIQTECNKTKSKHLKASKCLRTSFVAKEIIRTNSEKNQNINEQYS